jgi:hypothetical protein
MRRTLKLSLLCLAAGAGACSSPDLVVPTENLPYAGVRFINAVPDTAGVGGLDMRWVDLFENNAQFRITFRNGPSNDVSLQAQFKGAREGSRHFRIFLNDTIQSIASTVLVDDNVTLVKEKNYTAMLWGNARSTGADAMHFSFWEETVADPGAGKVALRIINTTSAAIDGYVFPVGGTAPATPTWPNVAAYSASSYVVMDTTQYRFSARAAGTATVVVGNTNSMTGNVPSCGNGINPTSSNPSGCRTGESPDIEAIPGTRVSQSAVSGIVWPRSTAGSAAPQTTSFQSPAITFVWDRRPPRTICEPYC